MPVTAVRMATPSAPASSAARAASASETVAITEIASPSEIAWLKRRGPATCRWTLDADRVPDGLQLEERLDLPRALVVRLPVYDALDVVGGEPLQLGARAVGAREVERVDVHVAGEPGRQLLLVAREDVDDAAGELGG